MVTCVGYSLLWKQGPLGKRCPEVLPVATRNRAGKSQPARGNPEPRHLDSRPCALITGRRHTLRKYDLGKHFKERKPGYVTGFVHEMMWGKTLRHLVKRGVELAADAWTRYGDEARINLHIAWLGNELVGENGIAQNPNN